MSRYTGVPSQAEAVNAGADANQEPGGERGQNEEGPAAASHNPLVRMIETLFYEPGQCYSEHSLLRIAVARGLLPGDYGSSSLSLFQAHFALMNALYRHRTFLFQQGLDLDIGLVDISTRSIADISDESLPAGTREANLGAYYLDWSNYEQATAESVDDLLASFWRSMGGMPVTDEQHRNACQVLGLSENASWPEAKAQYRRLAMVHHPDRGGDDQKLQDINQAIGILERALKC